MIHKIKSRRSFGTVCRIYTCVLVNIWPYSRKYSSPVLFCVYIDGLLRSSGVGYGQGICWCVGCADDLLVFSPTVSALHKMVGVCERYAQKLYYDVIFNVK